MFQRLTVTKGLELLLKAWLNLFRQKFFYKNKFLIFSQTRSWKPNRRCWTRKTRRATRRCTWPSSPETATSSSSSSSREPTSTPSTTRCTRRSTGPQVGAPKFDLPILGTQLHKRQFKAKALSASLGAPWFRQGHTYLKWRNSSKNLGCFG